VAVFFARCNFQKISASLVFLFPKLHKKDTEYIYIYENCPIAYYKLNIGKTIKHKKTWPRTRPEYKNSG